MNVLKFYHVIFYMDLCGCAHRNPFFISMISKSKNLYFSYEE